MSEHNPPASIVAAAVRFVETHPYLSDPENASGLCTLVSRVFAEKAPEAKVIYLLGCRTSFPDRVEYYQTYDDPDPYLCHAACCIGDWCIDFTRRQFDPTCDHPYIRRRDEFEREWMRVSDVEPDLSSKTLCALRMELDAYLTNQTTIS